MKRARRALRLTPAILVACALAAVAHAELLDASLTRADLRQRFSALRAAGTTVDAQLDWQFVFSGADPRALEALSVKLVSAGYRIVSLHSAERDDGLRVARVELHTPATLERRSRELRELARGHSGAAYEGAEPLPVR